MSDGKFKKLDGSMYRPKSRMEKPLNGMHLNSPVFQRCGMNRPSLERQRRRWRQMRMAIRVQTEAYHDSAERTEALGIARRLACKISKANRVFQLTFGLITAMLLFYAYDGFANTQTNFILTGLVQTSHAKQPKPAKTSANPLISLPKAAVTEVSYNGEQQAISTYQAKESVNIAGLAYDMDFKVRELTKGTGSSISNVRVDVDNGSYVGFTDASGVAHIPQIPSGTHTINISKDGYLEFNQANYNLDGAKTFNASIPKKTQVGPWGTTTLNADWYKATYIDAQDVGAAGYDPLRWTQIIPINNRIVAGRPDKESTATSTDSALVLQAINLLENNTGYKLINVVNGSATDTYSIYMESNTNVSNIWGENGTVFAGSSQITATNQTKRVIHEIVKQFDMWPMTLYPSVMDPQVTTQTDPQPYDYMHIALTIDEHLAKSRGEQDMFLGNMYNYSALTAPVKTAVTSPLNNATNLEKTVRLTWNNVIDANKYNVDIATDANFTNLVKDFNAQRIDTTITLNENTKYYMRVRAENSVGNATWSDVINFTTKSGIITPGNTSITAPVNGATNVVTPVAYTWTASSNATQYNLEVSLDNTFTTLVQDVIITTPATTVTLNGNRTYFNRVRGENTDATGAWSTVISYTTKNTAPSAATNLTPNNTSIDATQSNNFTWTKGSDVDLDALTQKAIIATTGWDTTIYNIATPFTMPANKLKNHTNYTWKIITSDGTLETTSSTINFNTINHAPTKAVPISPNSTETKDATTPITFTWTQSTDADKDPITYKIHLWNATKDTTINATTPYTLPANKLKGNSQYTYTITANDGIIDNISTEQKINTLNHAPSAATNLTPNNTSIDATTSNNFTWTKGTDIDLDALTQKAIIATTGWDTTIYNIATPFTMPANKLKNHTNYTWKIITSDGTLETTSSTINFNTINHAPSAFIFTTPTNNQRIEYVNGQLEIGTSTPTDKDNDPLTKTIHLLGNGIDTLMYTDATTPTIYLDAKRLNLNTDYTLSGEVTDGITTTPSNTITFKTPTGVGLEELIGGYLGIYPNPANDRLNIETKFIIGNKLDIKVFDNMGRIVVQETGVAVTEATIPLDVSALAPGLYTISVHTGKATYRIKAMIIR